MQMLELFPTTAAPADMSRDGAQRTRCDGRWRERNWRGWYQAREVGERNWRFHVHGFSGPEDGNGLAHVYRWTGPDKIEPTPVSIDGQNRITIDGRKYGRSFWDH